MRSCYFRCSKLTEARFRQIVRLFSLDLTASDAARLAGVSVRSVDETYLRLRDRLAHRCGGRRPFEGGEVEVDESYSGPRRARGKRGRGAGRRRSCSASSSATGGSTPRSCPTARRRRPRPRDPRQVRLEVVINSDGWRGYDGLVDVGYEKHLRIRHGENRFADGRRHINGIESFWGYAKRRLAKFNGVPDATFYLHPKEAEHRFNLRRGDLYETPLKVLRDNPP